MPPYLDTIEDHPLNKKHKELLNNMKRICAKYGNTKELWVLEDKENECYNTIMYDITDAVDKEMDENVIMLYLLCV